MPISYAHAYLVLDTTAGASEPASADRGKKRDAEEPAAEKKKKKKKKIKKTTARKPSSTSSAAIPPRPKPRPVGVG